MRVPRRSRAVLSAVGVAAAVAAIMPASALAGRDVHLIVKNDTPYNLKVLGTANFCWYKQDLEPSSAQTTCWVAHPRAACSSSRAKGST
ncbi:hypothetical protein AYO39_02520 [Actinobacteria bacterium SCGC AG-212-D09]|nr:hypothetical protein AYO39_02520 [Actinobacteria bacterium SCGC AG-212-D09]